MTGQYAYAPLDENFIRLVHFDEPCGEQLTFTLRHVALKEAPLFAALSYAWGSAANDSAIECDGKRIPVTFHLWNGLASIRKLQLCENIWVDAVCITQSDNLEKGTQVRRMRDIYQNAQRCIIWLGCPETGSDATLAIENLPSMNQAFERMTGPISARDEDLLAAGLPGLSSPVWTSLQALVNLSWFTRVWIVQEAALSQQNVFLYNSTIFEWKAFVDLSCSLNDSNLALHERRHDETSSYSAIMTLFFIEVVRNRLAQNADDAAQIVDLAVGCRYLQSSLKVDRIYGVLGLLSSENRAKVRVDYSESAKTRYWNPYVQYSRLCLELDKSLNVLSAIDANGTMSPFPSWCPDFSVPMTIFPFQNTYSAGKPARGDAVVSNVSTDEKAAKITGFQFDQVREHSNTTLALRNGDLSTSAFKLALEWVEKSFELASSVFPDWDPESLPQDFCAALSADLYPKDVYESPRDVCCEWIRWLRWSTLDPDVQEAWQSRVSRTATYSYWIKVWKACRGRRLFTTKGGRFGIGPAALRSEDVLVTFFNAPQCYVLRETLISNSSRKAWHILGAAYVHGMMNGEVFDLRDRGKVAEEVFEIY